MEKIDIQWRALRDWNYMKWDFLFNEIFCLCGFLRGIEFLIILIFCGGRRWKELKFIWRKLWNRKEILCREFWGSNP